MKARKYTVNDGFFSGDGEDVYYWAGFLAADGCIASRGPYIQVNLAAADEEHMRLLANAVEFSGPVGHGCTSGHHYCRLSITSNRMVHDLANRFRVTPRKSLTLQWPSGLSGAAYPHFLRGYFDGNGTCGFNPKSRRVFVGIAGSYPFLSGASGLLENAAGVRCCVYRASVGKGWNIILAGSKAVAVLRFLYDSAGTALARKASVLHDFLEFYDNNNWKKKTAYLWALS